MTIQLHARFLSSLFLVVDVLWADYFLPRDDVQLLLGLQNARLVDLEFGSTFSHADGRTLHESVLDLVQVPRGEHRHFSTRFLDVLDSSFRKEPRHNASNRPFVHILPHEMFYRRQSIEIIGL